MISFPHEACVPFSPCISAPAPILLPPYAPMEHGASGIALFRPMEPLASFSRIVVDPFESAMSLAAVRPNMSIIHLVNRRLAPVNLTRGLALADFAILCKLTPVYAIIAGGWLIKHSSR